MLTGKLILLIVLLVAGAAALVALAFSFRSLFQAQAYKRYLADANRALREGRQVEALKMFLKAESRWLLNSHDGGRDSLTADLDQYLVIARGVCQIVGKHAARVRSDVQGIVAEMKAHLKERNNFGIDGRRMKPDAAQRWQAMVARLTSLRARLRSTSQPAMLR